MGPLPRLAAIATGVPLHRLDQSNVVARVEQLFGRSPDFERLIRVYANSGIAWRYSVVPFQWFDEPHGWADRNRAYLTGARSDRGCRWPRSRHSWRWAWRDRRHRCGLDYRCGDSEPRRYLLT